MSTEPQLHDAVQAFLSGRLDLVSLCDAVDAFLAAHHDDPAERLAYAYRLSLLCSQAEDGILPATELAIALDALEATRRVVFLHAAEWRDLPARDEHLRASPGKAGTSASRPIEEHYRARVAG